MTTLLIPVAVLAGIGCVMAAMLAIGRKAFAVEIDERVEKVTDILPGANCGGCGFAGCSGFANALVEGTAKPTQCPPGGSDLAVDIGKILGIEVSAVEPKVALIACAGDNEFAPERSTYLGFNTCGAAHAVAGGSKKCTHGCLGLGSCNDVCQFGAVEITDSGLAVIVKDKCTGCGACLDACPRNIIVLVPKKEQVHVLCSNPDKAKAVKAVCSIGCTGCKICGKQSKRFVFEGALARIDTDSEGDIPETASWSCPQGAIFDERKYAINKWLTDGSARKEHEGKSSEWKEAEKAKKLAAKKAKEAKKAAAEEKAAAQADNQGGVQ